MEEPEEGESSGSISLDIEVEGTLWFSLKERRPVEFRKEVSGEIHMIMTMEMSEGFELEFQIEAEVTNSEESHWTDVSD